MLQDIAGQADSIIMSSFPKRSSIELNGYVPSEKFTQSSRVIFNQKVFCSVSRFCRVALVFLLVITLAYATLTSISPSDTEACESDLSRMSINADAEWLEVGFFANEEEYRALGLTEHETLQTKYIPTYSPKEATTVNHDLSPYHIWLRYSYISPTGKRMYAIYRQATFGAGKWIDNKITTHEVIKYKGYDALLSTLTGQTYRLHWSDGFYQYSVETNISLEEMYKIANSLAVYDLNC